MAQGSTGRWLLVAATMLAIGTIGARTWQDRPAPPTADAAPETVADVSAMVAKLETRLKDEPNDATGWRMLGWSYFNLRRFGDAAKAYRRAAQLNPGAAEDWSSLGEALVLGGKGVGVDAADAFRKALAADPKDARARYFLAVRQDMAGDHRGAIDQWIALLKDTPPGAPWEQSVRTLVEQVAAREHIDVAGSLPPPQAAPAVASVAEAAIPGPSQEQLAAAATMTPSQQDAMARGMVDRLSARLEADPKDLEGWIRLMRARAVLEDRDGARTALASARRAFAGNSTALSALVQAKSTLGL